MHIKFLDYLADPITKKPLKLEVNVQKGQIIESGILRSEDQEYPIINGIPRFVDIQSEDYTKSFSYQWKKWQKVQFESENIGKPLEGHTRGMWEKITGIDDKNASEKMKDKTIVDMGCGPGRFTEISRLKGAKVIALDHSQAVVEVTANNFEYDENVCVCQADILNLPICENSVDGAFSIGVLHHTPDPKRGVKEAFKMLKNNSWCAISVYESGGYYDLSEVQRWRKIFNLLWPVLGHYPPLIYTYIMVYFIYALDSVSLRLGRIVKTIFPTANYRDIKWSLQDTFDSLTPTYQSGHTCFEVFSMFKSTGFSEIEPTNWGSTSFRGIKNK